MGKSDAEDLRQGRTRNGSRSSPITSKICAAARFWTSCLTCSNACAGCSSGSSVRCKQRTLRFWTKAPLSGGASQRNEVLGDWRALISIKLATVMGGCGGGALHAARRLHLGAGGRSRAATRRPLPQGLLRTQCRLRSGKTDGQEAGPPRQGVTPLQSRSIRRPGHVRLPHPARQGHQTAACRCRASLWPTAKEPNPGRSTLRQATRGTQPNLRNHRPCAGLRNSQHSDNMLAFVARLAPNAAAALVLASNRSRQLGVLFSRTWDESVTVAGI